MNSWWWSLIASYLNIFCIKIENIERKSWPDSEPNHCLLVISPFPHHLEKLQYESIVKLYKSKKFGPKGLVISNPKALICYHSAKKNHHRLFPRLQLCSCKFGPKGWLFIFLLKYLFTNINFDTEWCQVYIGNKEEEKHLKYTEIFYGTHYARNFID